MGGCSWGVALSGECVCGRVYACRVCVCVIARVGLRLSMCALLWFESVYVCVCANVCVHVCAVSLRACA